MWTTDASKCGFLFLSRKTLLNESVENAGVAFVKGANEINQVFFFKNKETVMYDEQVWMNKAKD